MRITFLMMMKSQRLTVGETGRRTGALRNFLRALYGSVARHEQTKSHVSSRGIYR